MSQRRIAACVAVALALAAACSDSGTGPDVGPTLEGNFSLQTIDGAPLPIAQRKIVGPDSTTRSCTDYLASMQIVVSSGSATRSESHNGATLTIARRETVLMSAGQVVFTGTVDVSQLVFKRL